MALLLRAAQMLVEVVELSVAVRVLGAFGALAIRLQRVAEVVQQLLDDATTHRMPSACNSAVSLLTLLKVQRSRLIVGLPGGNALGNLPGEYTRCGNGRQ